MTYTQLQCYWNQRSIESFKGLRYAHSLSCLSCYTKWLVCTMCMERQSNNYRMKAHIERCSGITTLVRETLDIIVYMSLWLKQKHNLLKLTSSSDAQSFLSMIENDSEENARNKQKGQCYFRISHASSSPFFENN